MNQTIRKRIEDISNGIVPEGYKQTPFGIFPYDWESKSMNQICDIYSGGTPSTKKEEYWDGDIPWCCPTDITKSNKYIEKTERNISRQGLENSSATLMPINSILMCSRATIGPRCINKVPMATNQGFKNLLCKNKNDTEFVYYLLEQLVSNFLKTSSGSTFLELSKSELEKAEYYLSKSEVERNKIADILMKWDEIVELQEQYIQKLELRKKAIMKKLLTPKDGWMCVLVKDIFEITRGQVLPTSACDNSYQYPVYSSQTTNNGLMGYYHEYLFEDCITWTTDGANAGEVKFRKGKFYCTNVCGVLKSVEGFANECVAYIINSVSKSYVSYVGNPKLMNNTMGNIKLFLPAIEEQMKFSHLIDTMDEEISLQKEKLAKIKEQRKAMQQYLLTGIVRAL